MKPDSFYDKLLSEKYGTGSTHQPPLRGQDGYVPYEPKVERKFRNFDHVIKAKRSIKPLVIALIVAYWLAFVIGTGLLMYSPGRVDGDLGTAILMGLFAGTMYAGVFALLGALLLFPFALFFNGTSFAPPHRVVLPNGRHAYRTREYGWNNEEDAY